MPPKGTAGLARSRVRGSRREPLPPARTTANTSFIAKQPPWCDSKRRDERAGDEDSKAFGGKVEPWMPSLIWPRGGAMIGRVWARHRDDAAKTRSCGGFAHDRVARLLPERAMRARFAIMAALAAAWLVASARAGAVVTVAAE